MLGHAWVQPATWHAFLIQPWQFTRVRGVRIAELSAIPSELEILVEPPAVFKAGASRMIDPRRDLEPLLSKDAGERKWKETERRAMQDVWYEFPGLPNSVYYGYKVTSCAKFHGVLRQVQFLAPTHVLSVLRRWRRGVCFLCQVVFWSFRKAVLAQGGAIASCPIIALSRMQFSSVSLRSVVLEAVESPLRYL